MAIAAFSVLLALPLWAQHGGGHGGGGGGHAGGFGGHAGFGGGHSGGFGGGHMGSGGMRSGGGVSHGFTHGPSVSQRGFSHQPFLHNGFHSNGFHHGFHGTHVHTFGFRNNCFGFPCRRFGYPWGYGAYYDPWAWDWWNSDSHYDDDYNQNLAIANQMNAQSLAEQRMLQQEERDDDQDAYADRSSGSRQVTAPREEQQAAAIIPPTVLVFRDQHKEEVRNYAIVGQTLWNFAPHRTEKIPLADLDITATTKANDDRGVTFRVPVSGEAQ